MRLLLIHPRFGKLLWYNAANIEKLYDDEKFSEVATLIHREVENMCKKEKHENLENKSALPPKYQQYILKDYELDELHNKFCQNQYNPNHSRFFGSIKMKNLINSNTNPNARLPATSNVLCLWSFLITIACTIVKFFLL